MRRISLLMLLLAALVWVPCGFAQGSSADEAQIRALVQSEEDAWNKGDAVAFAAHYSETGSFTNVIGQQLYGKKAFLEQHTMLFSTIYQGSHSVFKTSKITFLRPDVALVEIDGAVTGAKRWPPGLKAGDDGALRVKLLEVMTREKDGWEIAAFHNVAVYPLPPAAPAK